MIMLRGHAGLLQSSLHHIGIVSEGVLLTADKVRGRKVLMVVRGQGGEDVAVLGVDTGVVIEDLHRVLVDDGHSFLVLLVRLVQGLVFRGDVVPMKRARDDGSDALDPVSLRRILDNPVGHLQSQRTASRASDGVKLARISAKRARVFTCLFQVRIRPVSILRLAPSLTHLYTVNVSCSCVGTLCSGESR